MIEHLSYSSVRHYLSCGRSWRYHYVDKVEIEKSGALLFGSAWHKMLGMVASGQDPLGAWSQAFNQQLETNNESGDGFVDLDILGQKMASQPKMAEYAKSMNPMELEQRFEFKVPGVPVPVIGFIDMITNDLIPVDFKTSKRKWSQSQADADLQVTFYIAGMHKLGLIDLADFPYPFEYHIFTKTKTPDIQILRTERTVEQVMGLFNLIGLVWDAIEVGVFTPNPTTWKCSPDYCDFWNRCKGGLRDNRG